MLGHLHPRHEAQRGRPGPDQRALGAAARMARPAARLAPAEPAPSHPVIDGQPAPDPNEECLPLPDPPRRLADRAACPTRSTRRSSSASQQHMLKAVREAKVHASWIASQPRLRRRRSPASSRRSSIGRSRPARAAGALRRLIGAIVTDAASNAFLADFRPFQQRIAVAGIYNSLAQTLLKLVAPGVPDIYQGTEEWELSLVDPDNRRPRGLRAAPGRTSARSATRSRPGRRPRRARPLAPRDEGGRADQALRDPPGARVPAAARRALRGGRLRAARTPAGSRRDTWWRSGARSDDEAAIAAVPRFLARLHLVGPAGRSRRGPGRGSSCPRSGPRRRTSTC